MKNYRSLMIILGVVAFIAGVVMMILGNMLGLLLLLAGFALIVIFSMLMLRTGGYRQEGIFFNGLGGQGRQQSEVSKEPVSGSGEQPANIWDLVENKENQE